MKNRSRQENSLVPDASNPHGGARTLSSVYFFYLFFVFFFFPFFRFSFSPALHRGRPVVPTPSRRARFPRTMRKSTRAHTAERFGRNGRVPGAIDIVQRIVFFFSHSTTSSGTRYDVVRAVGQSHSRRRATETRQFSRPEDSRQMFVRSKAFRRLNIGPRARPFENDPRPSPTLRLHVARPLPPTVGCIRRGGSVHFRCNCIPTVET